MFTVDDLCVCRTVLTETCCEQTAAVCSSRLVTQSTTLGGPSCLPPWPTSCCAGGSLTAITYAVHCVSHDWHRHGHGVWVSLNNNMSHVLNVLCRAFLAQIEARLVAAWSHADPGLAVTSSCPAFSD